MPINGNRENHKLKVGLMLLLAGGLVWAELGQNYTTSWGDPHPGKLFVYASVPYILLAFGQWVIARSRIDLIILLVCAVPITLANGLLFDKPDVFGLIHILVPIDSMMLATAALVVVLVRVLVGRWVRRGKES